MFLFGHVGITVGVAHIIGHKMREKIDLRKVAFLSVFPDLLDKPLGLILSEEVNNHSRLGGHSAIYSLFILAVLLMRRKPRLHSFGLWCAFFGHVILDRIWRKNLEAFFWPFWGGLEPLELGMVHRWYENFFDPYNLGGEILGLTILVALAAHYRLWRRDAFNQFISTGLIPNDTAR